MATSKDSRKATGASGKTDMLLFDPEGVIIVIDTKHPLYDDRVKLAVDEAMVLNIMANGVLEPILVRKNGETPEGDPIVEVIDGRGRTLACREANKRLEKQGLKTHRIPAIAKRATDAKAVGIMASTFIRREDTPLSRARKMQSHIDLGCTKDEVAVSFGVTAQTVDSSLALLDCADPVQHAVDKGDLPATVAKKLSKLSREEQVETLAEMKAEGATKGARAHAAADRATKPRKSNESGGDSEKSAKPLGKKTIAGIAKRLGERPIDDGFTPSAFASMVLDYVCGKPSSFASDYPWHASGTENN